MSDDVFLPFSRPTLSSKAIAEVVACLESGWLTTGPRTRSFEEALATYLEAPAAQCCASATAGLLMSLLALDLQPGDEVITTPMTFVATLNCIVQAGGTPRLVDVDAETYNLNVEQVAAAIGPRTRALMPVHFAGLPVDLDPLYALAKKHGLRVIEDAAHAIGASYKGKKIGGFGDIQVFSFHPNKNMTTGEGGAITCRDEALRQQINLLRFHGIDREAWARFSKAGSPHYDIALAGYKFNFMDLQAALGLHQLPQLDDFIAKRTARVADYYAAWQDEDFFLLPKMPDYEHVHAWHLFAPLVNVDQHGLSRDDFITEMKARNIGTGLHYQAIHLSRFYQERFGFKRGQFPQAEYISDRVVSLPLFPSMTDEDFDRVLAAVDSIATGQRIG